MKIKRVCLIIPPSGFLLDERVFVPLGILRVANALEESGYMVELLDLSGVLNYVEAVRDHAVSTKAINFGITATSPQLPAAVLISKVLRSVREDARVILGGPHVTLVNAALKKGKQRAVADYNDITRHFDVLVAGDGERAIFSAMDDASPKLIDADDTKSDLFMSEKAFAGASLPARHLIDIDSYHYSIDGERALSLIAQLGCPFSCRFCGGRSSKSFRLVRMRPTENVVDEMEHLYKMYGVKGFMLYDDELNVNLGMVDLMQQITKRQKLLGVSWKLRGFVKSELFTDQQAEVMFEAGFRWILVGFESGSPRILANMDKKSTREENTRAMEIARRHGLKVKALMSIGHPGESAETLRETRDWLIDVKPDDFDISIITTYPGTSYYDDAVFVGDEWVYTCPKSGDRLYQENFSYVEESNYYKGRPGSYRAYVRSESLSQGELVSARDELEYTLRLKLGIPFPKDSAALSYEHSMGQGAGIPNNILRISTQPLL